MSVLAEFLEYTPDDFGKSYARGNISNIIYDPALNPGADFPATGDDETDFLIGFWIAKYHAGMIPGDDCHLDSVRLAEVTQLL